MAERPYTLLSCAMSLDGYIGRPDRGPLRLSGAADRDRVDAERARCDAILVGAGTVRHDRPRLLVRSPDRRARRVRAGRPPSPLRVTVSTTGDLDPAAPLFDLSSASTLVYCPAAAAPAAQRRLGPGVTVRGLAVRAPAAGAPALDLRLVGEDLHRRGVARLLVEGGSSVHTQLLTAGLADELQLVVAPLLVGDARAARFVGDGRFPWSEGRRAPLAEVRRLDDVVLLRYALSSRFGRDRPQEHR